MRKKRIKSQHCNNCGYDFKISLQEVNYCPVCGQENHNPRLTLKYYVEQIFENIVHFDSKTLRSVWALLFKPGSVTKAYINNQRKKYSSPFRLFFSGLITFLFAIIFVNSLVYKKIEHSDKTTVRDFYRSLLVNANDSSKWTFNASPIIRHNIYVTDIRKLVFSDTVNVANWLSNSGLSNNWYNRLFYKYIRKYDRSELTRIEFDKRLNNFRYALLIITIPITALFVFILYYKKGLLFFDAFIFSVHANTSMMFMGILLFFVYVLPWQFLMLRQTFDVAFVLLSCSYCFNFFPASIKVFGFTWWSCLLRTVMIAAFLIPIIYLSHLLAQLYWV